MSNSAERNRLTENLSNSSRIFERLRILRHRVLRGLPLSIKMEKVLPLCDSVGKLVQIHKISTIPKTCQEGKNYNFDVSDSNESKNKYRKVGGTPPSNLIS